MPEDVAATEPTDEVLISKAQAEDTAAFDVLIRRYYSRLYGLVYNMTSHHEDTNDILQETFTKAYHALPGFRGNSSLYTWLHTIAYNKCLTFLKRRGKRYSVSLNDIDADIENDPDFIAATSSPDPSRETSRHDLQKKLNEALQKLSNPHRAVVTMFDIQGMPHAEIAQILKVSEGTVRSRLFYAHKQLQSYLHEYFIP